ncbi:MAG: hypothetical protein JXQ87_04480 [Bacteroidia bacterium]
MSFINLFAPKKNEELQKVIELRKQNPNTKIHDYVQIANTNLVSIGPRTKINRGVHLFAYGKNDSNKAGEIIIGENCLVSNDTKIFAGRGSVLIGDHVEIGMNCFISAQRRIKSRKVLDDASAIETLVTEIGDECMFASGCFIVEGSKLGNRCIVAAGAIVSGTFGDDLLLVGNPARPIPQKKNIS